MKKNKSIMFDSIGNGKVDFSEKFNTLFPNLSRLLQQASVVDFTLNSNKRFRQYIWVNKDGKTSGWLCKLEHCVPQGRNLIDEHIFLAKTMGGIIEYWLANDADEPNSFIDANTFTFSLPESHIGIGDKEDNYTDECSNAKSLDANKFVTFALEENGNATVYDYQTKEVFVYLHDDYSPFTTTPVEGYSVGTLYRYDNVKTFVDYVELLAKQWINILDL